MQNAIVENVGIVTFDMCESNKTEIQQICENHGNTTIIKLLLQSYIMDSAANTVRDTLMETLKQHNKGIMPNTCQDIIKVLKQTGDYPDTFSMPQTIYVGLERRKASSELPKWFIKNHDGIDYVVNNETGETLEKIAFDAILSLCRNLYKALSRKTVLERDKRGQVMKYVNEISRAVLNGSTEYCQQIQASLQTAYEQSKNIVPWTDAEKESIQKALSANPAPKIRKRTLEKMREDAARLAASEAQARLEATQAQARLEATQAQAQKDAELAESAKQTLIEQQQAWKEERERLRQAQAALRAKLTENSNKYERLLEILKEIPESCESMKKADMQKLLERLAKAKA